MSIISSYETDNSVALAKRFASLVASYFDNPTQGRDKSAQVALENLYRLLEMFRYDSFADESRRGVLALEGVETLSEGPLSNTPWHNVIEGALQQSLIAAYSGLQKDVAIDQIQTCLRALSKGEAAPPDSSQRTKGFLTTFEALV